MKNKNPLLPFIIVLVLIVSIYITIYLVFNVSPSVFGPIGDSIGGVIGPVLTLIAAYFAFRAYSKEQESLNEAKIQTQIQENNFKLAKEQYEEQ